MYGRLFLVVGNSGSGKDSLISYLKQEAGARLNFYFPKRWITRDRADDHEDYYSVTTEEFETKLKNGDFTVWWESYGFLYGIDQEIYRHLTVGRNILLNVSRKVVPELVMRFPETTVVLIMATPELVAARLTGRGRDTGHEIEERLKRAERYRNFSLSDVTIRNDGNLATVGNKFIAKIEKILTGKKAITVRVVGNAGAFPAYNSSNSSFIITHQHGDLLIDAAPNLAHIFIKNKYKLNRLLGIVITHDHSDHFLGLATFLHYFREHDIMVPIYAPSQTLATLRNFFGALRLRKNTIAVKPRFYPVDLSPNQKIMDLPALEVLGCPSCHSRDTIALRINDKESGSDVVFTSDTRPSEQLAKFAAQSHLFFHDCAGKSRFNRNFSANHSSSLDAGRIAKLAEVERLVLTHLDYRFFKKESDLIKEAAREFSGKITVAQGGQIYTA